MDCQLSNCEAHVYMSEALKEMKSMSIELSRGQQALENSVVKLTENFNEMQRINQRLEAILLSQKKKDDEQDKEIMNQRDFMNKAIGILGAITFLVPFISAFLQYTIKQ